MKTIMAGWKRAAFGLAVAGAMGFGATQAVAAPREAETRACGATACARTCPDYGGTWVNGRCICCYPS